MSCPELSHAFLLAQTQTIQAALSDGDVRRTQEALDTLDTALVGAGPSSPMYASATHQLRKWSQNSGLLPSSCLLVEGTITLDSVESVSSSALSDVYRGQHAGVAVAVKSLRLHGDDREKVKQSFRNEVITWMCLGRHPNIVPFRGQATIRSIGTVLPVCLVSNWMIEGTLSSFLRRNPSEHKLKYVRDIVLGLQFIHSLGIVHGDLKSANVLVDEHRTARLADFGLTYILYHSQSAASSMASGSGGPRGTVRWLAPEFFPSSDGVVRAGLSVASDIYALAMTVWEVFSGEVPFKHEKSDYSVVLRIVKGERPSRPAHTELSDAVWRLLERSWDANIQQRPVIMEYFKVLEIDPKQVHQSQVRFSALRPFKFQHLPLGEIQPLGWIANQLRIQAEGLAGRLYEFYPNVAQSLWTSGTARLNVLDETAAYWFNGIVAHAFVADDQRLKDQAQAFLDQIIANQAPDGWLGPEPRVLWGRYPALLGMMQFAEADPTQTVKIVHSMMKFVVLAHSMLRHNHAGLDKWGASRWQDFALVVQWLYDSHPSGHEDMLLETLTLLQSTGIDWASVFASDTFPVDTIQDGPIDPRHHGVNVAQALKAAAINWRFSHQDVYKAAANQCWDIVYQYHGLPSGAFAADNSLAGKRPMRGAELCLVVEAMYSGSYTYKTFGNNAIADRVERMAYNALPAALTSNMWSRQFVQQLNQVRAAPMASPPYSPRRRNPYLNVFGLQHGNNCCTANHSQGFPKFVASAFLTADRGRALVQVYLGPVRVHTTLAGDNAVAVTVETNYPLADTVRVAVNAHAAYTHYVRVPEWAKRSGLCTIVVDGGTPRPLAPNADSLCAVRVPAGTTTFVLELPANIELTHGVSGGVHVNRGPLLFAGDITRVENILDAHEGNANAVDIAMEPDADFRFAIDPATLAYHNTLPRELPNPIFESRRPPNTVTAVGCCIDWAFDGDSAADPPANPVPSTGERFEWRGWPYASAKLRIAELPTFTSRR